MCGLYGAIGLGWNEGIIRALAWANMERGTDSTGFFDSTGKMIKCAECASDALRKENINKWLDASCKGCEKLCRIPSWFIAGHTRAATRGKVNRQNSHPFRYGRIIGSHNGMVDSPNSYVVDSQYLFDSLNTHKGDYNAAWSNLTGYWAVTWFDDAAFYVQVHNGDLTVAKKGDVWYYSSSWAHLQSAIGIGDEVITLKEGETFKFELVNGKIVRSELPKFVSSVSSYWVKKYGGYQSTSTAYDWDDKMDSNKRHGKRKSYYEDNTNVAVKDYDAEWREAWETYCTESEHSKL